MNNYHYILSLLLVLMLFSCSQLSPLEKKHRKIIKKEPFSIRLGRTDTFSMKKVWTTKSPLRYHHLTQEIESNEDSIWVRKIKWTAHRRHSPNALNEGDKTEILYVNDIKKYVKIEKINLILMNSSHKTITKIFKENGEVELIFK